MHLYCLVEEGSPISSGIHTSMVSAEGPLHRFIHEDRFTSTTLVMFDSNYCVIIQNTTVDKNITAYSVREGRTLDT